MSANRRERVLGRIRDLGLIPVVRAQSADEAIQAIEAIREGGVDVLEITMTVPDAVPLIEKVARRFGGDAVIGAGTVLDAETARACILAGAQFVVAPSLS
jgi:2-dehydro-3-deoxyphosphogluconate aldolase/(4S)-4-hydroxy-2-oxoglutarate aldolase